MVAVKQRCLTCIKGNGDTGHLGNVDRAPHGTMIPAVADPIDPDGHVRAKFIGCPLSNGFGRFTSMLSLVCADIGW